MKLVWLGYGDIGVTGVWWRRCGHSGDIGRGGGVTTGCGMGLKWLKHGGQTNKTNMVMVAVAILYPRDAGTGSEVKMQLPR
jgi:hypothetical protein